MLPINAFHLFTVPKLDNHVRLMLNLWSLNFNVIYHHFKIDPLHCQGRIIRACWIASSDVKLLLDNIAAVLNINRKGTTHNSTCNDIKVQFWEFCQEHIIFLNAYHMTGTDIIAYWESRHFITVNAKWRLNPAFLNLALPKLTLNLTLIAQLAKILLCTT